MTGLLTGGAGFIGQHLARRLTTTWDLQTLDVLSPQVHQDGAASRAAFPGEVIEQDVCDPESWERLPRPDFVIHLAAETGTAQSMYKPNCYHAVNVEGTRLAARAAQGWGVPLLVLSSRAVYGEGRYRCPDGKPVFGLPDCPGAVPQASQESDPQQPVSVYGQTKAEAETEALRVAASIPVGIIRPQNVIGPGQALHNPYTGVLAAFLARLKESRPLQIYGDGTQTRDFIHVSDVAATVDWLLRQLLSRAAASPVVLNCGTGKRTTLTELATYANAGAPTADVPIEQVPVHRAGDIRHACADLQHAAVLGAPAPRLTTSQAVASFISWSWEQPGVSSQAWEAALQELDKRGLTT